MHLVSCDIGSMSSCESVLTCVMSRWRSVRDLHKVCGTGNIAGEIGENEKSLIRGGSYDLRQYSR